jgi:hypothetical protein
MWNTRHIALKLTLTPLTFVRLERLKNHTHISTQWMTVNAHAWWLQRCLQHNRHSYVMRKFQILFERLRVVVEWIKCLPVVVYWVVRVRVVYVVHEYSVDASRVGERRMKRIWKNKKETGKEKRDAERGIWTLRTFSFSRSWNPH